MPGHQPRQDLLLFRLVPSKATDAASDVIVIDADGHSGRTGLAGFTTMLLTGRIGFQSPAAHASALAVASIASEC